MPIVIIQIEFGQWVNKIARLSSFMRVLPKIYEFLFTRWCDVHIWCISKNKLCMLNCLNVLHLHICCLYIHILFMNHSSRKLGCHLHTTTWYKWFLLFQSEKNVCLAYHHCCYVLNVMLLLDDITIICVKFHEV
jgi:hypothetical protein